VSGEVDPTIGIEMGPGSPTAPIALGGDPAQVVVRGTGVPVEVPADLIARLREVCGSVTTDAVERAEVSRDWWPLAMTWALENQVGGLAGVVATPSTASEVADVLALCHEAAVPVTAAAGRSGVCGASVPAFGGVVLNMCALAGVRSVDTESLILDVLPGTFGDHLEKELREDHGLTLGHWPQSMTLSTVGGWLACRSAGQLSNRYGKIEDMVVGLDVILADGRSITTGGPPRSAVGPDLTQVFVGSEGTLGIIVGARLKLHRAPLTDRRLAVGFSSFRDGLDACRRILQRGAHPAVLRLYDAVESDRNYSTGDDHHVVLALDEGDPTLVEATMSVVAEECAAADRLDEGLVEQWMEHRNNVDTLESLIANDLVVDTMEISAPWSALFPIYEAALAAIGAVDGTLAVSAHQSHAYNDGACLYFTFAGKPPVDAKDAYYRAAWDAGTRAVLDGGGALSHHHGVGLNRDRFVADALGSGFDVLTRLKSALDPAGVLNPGKLGLPSPFGTSPWP
jgi:alkyldihydroxyacetonephosphate synthase